SARPRPSGRSSGSGAVRAALVALAGTPMAAMGWEWGFTSSDGSWSDKTDGYHCVRAMEAAPSPRFGWPGPTPRPVPRPHRRSATGKAYGVSTTVQGRAFDESDGARGWSMAVPHHASGARH